MERVFKLDEIERVAGEFVSELEIRGAVGAPLVVGFSGNLGSGKTTFTKEVLKQLGHVGGVPSPTFVLRRDYVLGPSPLQGEVRRGRAIHIDAYRLESPENIWQVISHGELEDQNNLIIIEWPEKVDQNIFHKIFLFEHIDEDTRRISLHN